jgi:hypothetical protein
MGKNEDPRQYTHIKRAEFELNPFGTPWTIILFRLPNVLSAKNRPIVMSIRNDVRLIYYLR